MNRRRVLQLSALGGGALLAGCGGSPGDGTPTSGTQGPNDTSPGDGPEDVDTDFLMPINRAMEEIHFFNIDMNGFREWQYFTREMGAYGKWIHSDYVGIGELNYRLYENVELTENELTIEVRDDANWSNTGNPITGRDAIVRIIEKRLSAGAMPLADVGDRTPSTPVNAVTDFEYDGKTATLYSDGGYFGDLIKQTIWLRLLVEAGVLWPTDVEPYKKYADEVFGLMEQAVNGEADPWAEGTTQPPGLVDETYQSDRDPLHAEFKDSNAIVCGAVQPKERQDSRLILEPNEHHRHADEINFNRVIMETATNTDQIWSAIQNERYAFAGAEPPSYVAEGFPDTYQAVYAPDDDGVSIVCNLDGPNELLSDVRVRQAVTTALDQPAICEQLHPRTWEPIETPGVDSFGKPDFIEDSWWEENLRSYAYDEAAADELMAMAEGNYERNSNGWFADSDGNVPTFQIHTGNPVPQVEPLIAEQLKDWGLKSEFVTLESTILESEMADGNLNSWMSNMNAGSCLGAATGWSYGAWNKNHLRRYGWWKGPAEENIENTPWDEEGFVATEEPSELDHLVVEAPPVGEFEGDLQEYPTVSMTQRVESGDPQAVEEDWPKLIWIGNWYLHGLPIAIAKKQFFVNTENWHWPTDHSAWEYAGITTRMMHQHFMGWGDQVFANPDNPPQ